jgi:hypothetical protein
MATIDRHDLVNFDSFGDMYLAMRRQNPSFFPGFGEKRATQQALRARLPAPSASGPEDAVEWLADHLTPHAGAA